MNDETAVVATDTDTKRKLALLKAIGLDKVPPEQRELALNIAKRYDLDLMLKHLVLIEGKPYITRDGLLWVAHRSGQLDGIEVSEPTVVDMPGLGSFWRAQCSVYRKDMSRPITYAGRYPVKGKNLQYGPEMAVKVSEVMALRRAFNVSAPTIEERWEQAPIATDPAEPKPTLHAQIAQKREAVTTQGDRQGQAEPEWQEVEPGTPVAPPPAEQAGARTETQVDDPGNPDAGIPMPAPSSDSGATPLASESDVPPERCEGFHKEHGACRREAGHKGNCQNAEKESWR